MSLVRAGPLTRRQLSPFPASLSHEPNQQVPGSPLSPFWGYPLAPAPRPSSPSSGSPLAQVPETSSPLLRQLLAGSRKRQREDATPSPAPASKRGRDSPRVPNSIIVVRRRAPSSNKDEQVVPNISTPELTKSRECLPPEEESKRKLPDVRVDNAKPLDLFGETIEIFAHSREE